MNCLAEITVDNITFQLGRTLIVDPETKQVIFIFQNAIKNNTHIYYTFEITNGCVMEDDFVNDEVKNNAQKFLLDNLVFLRKVMNKYDKVKGLF